MSNANIFMVYQDGKGNVTLSPRHASGEFMPQYDSAIDAELLSGSGVSNGVMTANIRCGNCDSWRGGGNMDFKASSGGFIHARLSGSSLDSTDPQQQIREHSTHGSFDWQFTPAVGGASANPFQDTNIAVNTTAATASSSSGINRKAVLRCHGVLASVAFVLLFPLGGILIRVGNFPGLIWAHAALQMVAWALFVTAVGLGIYYGNTAGLLHEKHPIIGLVLFVVMIFQPFLGYLHHLRFVKTGGRSLFSHGHIWIGRIAIILGIINGGLGMKLAQVSNTFYIVYSVFAGVFGLAYLASIAYGEMAKKTPSHNESSGSARDQEKLQTKD